MAQIGLGRPCRRAFRVVSSSIMQREGRGGDKVGFCTESQQKGARSGVRKERVNVPCGDQALEARTKELGSEEGRE